MNHRGLLAACGLLAALSACGRGDDRPAEAGAVPMPVPGAPNGGPPSWRSIATEADRARLRDWRDAWMAALASVRAGGKGAEITRDAALFDPDRALDRAMPPPGDYRCRVVKLGAKGPSNLPFVAYPAFACRIAEEGDVVSLAKVTGSQRTVGLLLPDTPARAVYLGTLVLGDETNPMQYGADAQRDMAGFVERIGERRWRLVLPAPAFESLLDVVELVPA